MWDLPGPGLEPMSPALAGGFLNTAPPGKSNKGDSSTIINYFKYPKQSKSRYWVKKQDPTTCCYKKLTLKTKKQDFLGGAVVKNRLPLQGTRVRALVWEDPTCSGAT